MTDVSSFHCSSKTVLWCCFQQEKSYCDQTLINFIVTLSWKVEEKEPLLICILCGIQSVQLTLNVCNYRVDQACHFVTSQLFFAYFMLHSSHTVAWGLEKSLNFVLWFSVREMKKKSHGIYLYTKCWLVITLWKEIKFEMKYVMEIYDRCEFIPLQQ